MLLAESLKRQSEGGAPVLTLMWRSSGRCSGRALGARWPSTCISITSRLLPGHSCLRVQEPLAIRSKRVCSRAAPLAAMLDTRPSLPKESSRQGQHGPAGSFSASVSWAGWKL